MMDKSTSLDVKAIHALVEERAEEVYANRFKGTALVSGGYAEWPNPKPFDLPESSYYIDPEHYA